MDGIGTYGVWYPTSKLDMPALAAFAQRVEQLGYATLWYPEAVGWESLSQAAFLLCNTDKLLVGSSIANIYARDAVTTRQGQITLNAISNDRFILGLGVSHIPLVEAVRGHVYGKPVASMRAYLEGVRGEGAALSDPARTTVIAALGPNMLKLARDATRGAIPYNVTPDHTAQAREILGSGKWLCVEQKVCLESDATTARTLAAKELARYMVLPNYRNNWLRQGFTEADLEGQGSDRFLDAMVVWGDEAAIHARLQAHLDAGADHVCLQPVHADGDAAALDRTVAALAPG
ncbi:MAG: TIGR03620 family F420-dependent LLM class oxidoreductase [Alphaproteobacteria bacterium]